MTTHTNDKPSDYKQGLDDGIKIALDALNIELGTSYTELGYALNHIWRIKVGLPIRKDQQHVA